MIFRTLESSIRVINPWIIFLINCSLLRWDFWIYFEMRKYIHRILLFHCPRLSIFIRGEGFTRSWLDNVFIVIIWFWLIIKSFKFRLIYLLRKRDSFLLRLIPLSLTANISENSSSVWHTIRHDVCVILKLSWLRDFSRSIDIWTRVTPLHSRLLSGTSMVIL